jgi:beta-N-acetylhexosaminidase
VIRPGRDARRAAGRLCIVDFAGEAPDPRLERLIADWHIGGVCLFAKNVSSPAQVAALTAVLRRIARASGTPPVWIAIDHEGGAVNRFAATTSDPTARGAASRTGPVSAGPSVTLLPGAMALGATGDPALVRDAGRVAGAELRAMGINLNFAPVLDVNTNPANPVIGARAFGESALQVGRLGQAYIAGLQAAGVAATAKHFPGHGDVTVDSHQALPRVAHPKSRLEAVELTPFRAAAGSGVAAVMTAHVLYPALDPENLPATMSTAIVTGILREAWGYDGLVCSDALSMRAIADHFAAGDAAVRAVAAGCDLVLALGPDKLQDEILERIASAIEMGTIPGARVSDALQRIGAAAARWAIGADHPQDLEGHLGTPEHLAVARRIGEAAVTLLRDRHGAIPLRAGCIHVVSVGGPAAPSAEGEGEAEGLATALRRYHGDVRALEGSTSIVAGTTEGEGPAGASMCVAVTRTRGVLPAGHDEAIRMLHQRYGPRFVLLAAGDPYDLLRVPEVPACLCTYGADPWSLDAAARVLLGLSSAQGRLPVTLPGLYPAGHGMGSVAPPPPHDEQTEKRTP